MTGLKEQDHEKEMPLGQKRFLGQLFKKTEQAGSRALFHAAYFKYDLHLLRRSTISMKTYKENITFF